MSGKHKFTRAYKGLDTQKANELNPIPGILGFLIGGVRTVEVPNRNGYVYVRLRDNLSEVCQAYNDNVSPVYGLPVLMVRDSTNRTRYKILGRDLGRYQDWGTSSPYLPRHGAQHSFNPPDEGGDVTWIYSRQLMPLSVYPSGSYGAGNVLIYPHTFYRNNTWHYAGGTGTASFLPYKPTGSAKTKMVLLYIDDSDAPAYVAGVEFDESLTGTVQVFPYIPSVPITSGVPLAAIRLVTGTSVILWDNIYDLRPWIVGDSFIPTGTSGHIIQDEGVARPNRAILDFIGANVWAIDNPGGGKTDIIISGTSTNLGTGARVRVSGTFFLNSGDYVILEWGEVIDDGNYFSSVDPTRITFNTTGWYSVNVRFQLFTNVAVTGTTRFVATMVHNGTDWNEYLEYPMYSGLPSNFSFSPQLSIMAYMTSGEYIEVEVTQNTGNSVRVNGASGGSLYETSLTVVEL